VIKSMTGFAALTREDDTATVSVTVKAVNHRFLDLQLRVPSAFQHLEGAMRTRVQAAVARGRIELQVSVQPRGALSYDVQVNEAVIAAIDAATAKLRVSGVVTGQLTLSDVLRLPQAITIREVAAGDTPAEGGTAADPLVLQALTDTLEALDGMRRTEGALLRVDLDARLDALSTLVEGLVVDAQAAQDALQARLQERISSISIEPSPDHAALAAEIVRFVARSDIQEEVVRFRSHLAHWRSLADGGEPCGRKLDFLIQEMNREINTIGSKAEGTDVPARVVTAKAELERLREQVQNVE